MTTLLCFIWQLLNEDGDLINNLYSSMRNRIQLCLENNGSATWYWPEINVSIQSFNQIYFLSVVLIIEWDSRYELSILGSEKTIDFLKIAVYCHALLWDTLQLNRTEWHWNISLIKSRLWRNESQNLSWKINQNIWRITSVPCSFP